MESFESKKAAPEQKHTEEVYNAYIMQTMPKTKTFSGCIKAFLVGGLICAIGQGFIQWDCRCRWTCRRRAGWPRSAW